MTRCAALLLTFLAALSARAEVPDYAAVRAAWRPSVAMLLDRRGEALQGRRVDFGTLSLDWVGREALSPAFVATLVAFEDARFATHHGVDWRAVAAALWQNLAQGAHRGASTISMQVAGLVEGRGLRVGRRSLREKWRQMSAAGTLERSWSKDRILEAYVNLVSYRGDLRGIGAAAAALFGKRPSGLDGDESILLATLVSSPNVKPERLAARACVLARAHGLNPDCPALGRLAAARLGAQRAPLPLPELAPHLAQRLLQRGATSLMTTLDARIQRLVRTELDQQLAALGSRNVRDAAAVVVDNASGEVLAYVGAAGQRSRARAVDGVRAPRQAGSTLKPFLYGLAFERRYLTPASLLDDSPINLETATGLYIPQNYDRDFKGIVSARTALASSLNVPAVRTLVLAGVRRLRDRLFDLGYAGITEDGEYYGYSLALGSAEVTLLEQANAYRTLANGGRWSPLRLQPAEPAVAPLTVMPEAVAFLVADILADPAARAVTFGLDSPLTTPFWSAVKTGTSKSMRDNWCIGFSDRYTVAVWVGNFEGDSMDEVSGVSGAAPAWLGIVLALHADVPGRAPVPPPGLVQTEVRFEPEIEPRRREWFLAGTEMKRVALASSGERAPRITSPPNGVIIALDPDIPHDHQSVTLASLGQPGASRFVLDGRDIAAAAEPYAWSPQPGYHHLELRNGMQVLDRIRFTVRMPH